MKIQFFGAMECPHTLGAANPLATFVVEADLAAGRATVRDWKEGEKPSTMPMGLKEGLVFKADDLRDMAGKLSHLLMVGFWFRQPLGKAGSKATLALVPQMKPLKAFIPGMPSPTLFPEESEDASVVVVPAAAPAAAAGREPDLVLQGVRAASAERPDGAGADVPLGDDALFRKKMPGEVMEDTSQVHPVLEGHVDLPREQDATLVANLEAALGADTP